VFDDLASGLLVGLLCMYNRYVDGLARTVSRFAKYVKARA